MTAKKADFSPDELMDMLGRRSSSVEINGASVPIVELSIPSRMALSKCEPEDTAGRVAMIVKHGVPLLFDVPLKTIEEKMSPGLLVDISNAVMRISGMLGDDEGN